MNPRQAAAYRDEVARTRLGERVAEAAAARAAERARPKRAYKRRPLRNLVSLPPRSAPVMPPANERERALMERLLPHVCADSVIDRESQALGVARMILNNTPGMARR